MTYAPSPTIEILFKDQDLLIVNKPAGITVIPERYDTQALNLVELLKKQYASIYNLHRLDKETTGIVAFGLDPEHSQIMHTMIEAEHSTKTYHAIVTGIPSWQEFECHQALLIDGDRLHRSVPGKHGKPCWTSFKVLEKYSRHCLVEARLHTGRTHQIRAHAAFIGYPVVADSLYGGTPLLASKINSSWKGDKFEERPLINRCALHAFSLVINPVADQQALSFEAPYPKDLRASLSQLRKSRR